MLFIILILLQMVFATSGSSKAMANHSCGSSITVVNTGCSNGITTFNPSCNNSITTANTSCGNSITTVKISCGSIITIVPASCGSSIVTGTTSCGSSLTAANTSCGSSIATDTTSCGSSLIAANTSCGSSLPAANLDATNFKLTRDIVRRNVSDTTFKAEVLALNLEVAADMVDQAACHQAIVNCTWEDFPLSKSMWEHIIRLRAAVFRYRAGVETLEPSQVTTKDAAINFLREGALRQAQIFDTEIGTIIHMHSSLDSVKEVLEHERYAAVHDVENTLVYAKKLEAFLDGRGW